MSTEIVLQIFSSIYSGIGDYIFDPKQSSGAKNQKISFDKPVKEV